VNFWLLWADGDPRLLLKIHCSFPLLAVPIQLGEREKRYVHCLNSTLTATERTLCALLENYQTPEGVVVPEKLRPFMGGVEFIKYTAPVPKKKV
jgi:hypothetical protein